jgi:RimJ/RimL family protein N-acetyltransferase
MITVSVGPMQSSEASRTAQLIRSVISPLSYYSEAARTAEIAKYTEAGLQQLNNEDQYSVLVARSEDALVGFCISRYDDGIIWLAWFGVREDFRGTNAARELLKALDEATHARGCSKIWCDTRTENIKSQRVLEREGFSRTCTMTRHWYGQDFYLWEKFVGQDG